MRTACIFGLLMLLVPATAMAQAPPAQEPAAPPPGAASPAAAPPHAARRGDDISRDDYVAHAVERAKRAAERRFDAMDTDHDGVLTATERRAYRQARHHAADEPVEPAPPAPSKSQ